MQPSQSTPTIKRVEPPLEMSFQAVNESFGPLKPELNKSLRNDGLNESRRDIDTWSIAFSEQTGNNAESMGNTDREKDKTLKRMMAAKHEKLVAEESALMQNLNRKLREELK